MIAEAGVAAHWLYNAGTEGTAAESWEPSGCSPCWTSERNAGCGGFWDHVKRWTSFPMRCMCFTPKSQIMALPRGATVVDFAYAIHSNVGDRTTAAKINNEQVPLHGAEKR